MERQANHKDKGVTATVVPSTEPQVEESTQILQDRLRDCYIQYKETAQRCQIQFKTRGAHEQQDRLYYSPNVPFFEEPEKQKIFRKEFINDVSRLPEPKPVFTLADIMHSDAAMTIGDRSTPADTKQELIDFYTRRKAQLQHRKHKLIKRWANTVQTADQIDILSKTFDKEIAHLQIEQDSIVSRLMRLQPDDRYCNDNQNLRPKPTSQLSQDKDQQEMSKLYKEADQQTNDSALTQEDIQVFLRHSTYANQINRPAQKLIQNLKWLSFEKRHEVWSDSRVMMHGYHKEYLDQRFKVMFVVANEVKKKLAEIGVIDEKGITACTERYVYHLKDGFISRTQQLLNSQKFTHQKPFMLFAGKAELKFYLETLSAQYGLNSSQVDLDQGQMFTYQLQTFFPSKFEKQVRAMTFDWEDTGANADMQIIDRLTRSLELNKDQIISEMARISAEQRSASLLNALNVGKTGSADLTLKDLTENELNKDEFTRHNLIKKLKQIEFFSLEESAVKIRRADWLDYVCWQPTVSIHVQRQNQLISAPKNQTDHLLKAAFEFADVHDAVIVNKIIDDAIKVHITKISETQNRIATCKAADSNTRGSDYHTGGTTRSLIEATNPAIAREIAKQGDQTMTEAQINQFKRFQDIPSVDPLTQSLTKAYHTLRLIKTRDLKNKLLSVVNYFRAIQRILALDTREFMTRERAYGDHLDIIDPHFGQNSKGQQIVKIQPPAGPAEIFNSTVEFKCDTNSVKGEKSLVIDPVTFKAFKIRNQFDPIAISTCPVVPKHHRTFGRPPEYQSGSRETENEKYQQPKQRMKSLLTMRDKLHVSPATREIYVTNEFGMPIVYYEALNDLQEIEEELIKIGSFYINQYEYVIQNTEILDGLQVDQARPTSLIDRSQMTADLLENEYNFQWAKVEVIETLMQCYEHAIDPLESMRILQIIVDLIVARPRLNTEASMYCESYLAETEALNQKRQLFAEFLQLQKDHETQQNEQIQNYVETKIRKLQECVDNYWAVKRVGDKKKRIGSNETNQEAEHLQSSRDDQLKQKIENSEKIELEKKDALAKIKQRHITEFANEQYTDFASVLGLPEVTLEQLYLRFDESEPIVLDALRETAFFQNMVEGFPRPFAKIPLLQPQGQHIPECGVQDFFDSLSMVTRFNAAIVQSLDELERETFPENGFAATCLEVCFLKKARMTLKQQRSYTIEGKVDPDYQKGQQLFEEDLYLGNADKLVYQMRQFHFECHPDNLYRISNPLVISKLDTESVKNYNFPRIRAKEVVEALQKDGVDEQSISDLLIQKTTLMAKQSVARPNLSYVGTQHYDKDLSAQEAADIKRKNELQLNVPSIMKMSCNIMEAVRLREEIIMRMNESSILARIYDQQCADTGKQAKYAINEQVSFATNQVTSDLMNIVDLNDGMNLKFSTALPFMEFDRSLAANLDFKSESCIKVLCTDLGVEELRAILQLQLAHLHLLIVAVKTNQLLIDKPLRGLAELELIDKKEITTPNSIIDLWSILGGNTDTANLGMIKSERMRMRQYLTKNAADCLYMLLPRKQRDRQILVKRFQSVQQKLLSSDLNAKPELVLRILRSYRLQLCHGYSQSMLQEAWKDSIKIQLHETCNVLRLRATLLPKSSQIFRLGKSDTQENLSFETNAYLRKTKQFETDSQEMSLNQILTGSICTTTGTMFYIPSQEEITFIDRAAANSRVLKEHTLDHVAADTIDQVIKSLVQTPKLLSSTQYKMEGKQQFGVRKVWLEETQNLIQHETYQALVYYSQILNIFDLEYTMLRNLCKSWQSLALESKALSGRPFWAEILKKKTKFDMRQMQEHMQNEALVANKTSLKVIQYLDERKKQWVDLEEDMTAIAQKLKNIQSHCFELPSDKRTMSQYSDLFALQHQATYFAFLNGLENMIEYYLDKQNDEYFYKLLLVRDQLTNKSIQSVAIVRSNGFYIQQQHVSALAINLDSSKQEEFNTFKKASQTVIDEKCLVPKQVTLLQQFFGQQSICKVRETRFGYQDLLKSAFYNMDDESRGLMGANFTQVDEYINDFLVFKGLKEAPHEAKTVIKSKNHFFELLQAQIEILSYKIEASHLERVIMCWDRPFLPKTTQSFHKVQRRFRDTHTMSILRERDILNDLYWKKQNKQNPTKQLTPAEKEKQILSGLFSAKMQQQSYFSKVNHLRAEISTIKNVLDVKLIRIGIEMVSNEHSALQVCFDVAAEDKMLQIYVHPSQQFASTPYAKVDKAPHLDVVTKVGCLQQFLTRLKNRSTEVETLTSGPGLVFSMKDFNDCLSLFARQLIKYGEEELRGRTETQNLREYQYHHLIYIKQMEALYYRKKCEQLLVNVDNLTNAKMLSQGNQIIFELDVGARELQTLKDHYYIMERCIRKEIRQEFNSTLLEKTALIEKQRDDFGQFRREVNIGLSEEVTKEINALEAQIKLQNHLRQSSTKYLKMEAPETKTVAPEMISEILMLTKHIRTQKMFYRFKQMIMQEKHDKELAMQKAKLTQNMGLWESLAESEKREQITQQELTITKNNLMHYERLIEKLYSQLEHINNQKVRLEQYKKNRSKQINELEAKMQDLEILESLDLNKILEEIRQRDKKITVLDKVDQNFNQRLEQLQGVFQQETDELKKTLQRERQAKQEAFEKLDAMRVEMKSLEGKDTVKNDLWKHKCKELYDVCKELQDENDNLKQGIRDLNHQLQLKSCEVVSNTMHNSTSEQSAQMSREQIILNRRKLIQKPMTAVSEHRHATKKDTLEGLKVSALGYDRNKLNTKRNTTGDQYARQVMNTRQSGATESQTSNQDQVMRAKLGPVTYVTLIPQVSSMPQIKGYQRQTNDGQLMADSARSKK